MIGQHCLHLAVTINTGEQLVRGAVFSNARSENINSVSYRQNMSALNVSLTELTLRVSTASQSMLPASIIGSVLILVNNLLNIATLKSMRRLQMQHYFMFSLAIADLFTLIPYIVFLKTIAAGKIWLSELYCTMLGTCSMVSVGATTWIHSAMSLERCISVLKPIEHMKFVRSGYSGLVTIGIIVCCIALPSIYSLILLFCGAMKYEFFPPLGYCKFGDDFVTLISVGIGYMAIPMIIEMLTHVLILNRMRKLIGADKAKLLKAVRTIGVTLGCYYLCWTPMSLVMMWDMMEPNGTPELLRLFATDLVFWNSFASLPIYLSCMERFRNEFLRLIFCSRNRVSFRMASETHVIHVRPVNNSRGTSENLE